MIINTGKNVYETFSLSNLNSKENFVFRPGRYANIFIVTAIIIK